MRKFYQTSWHGIAFESFAELSASQLPDSSFYASFYEVLHRKYKGIDDLDQSWVSLKLQAAEWIINNLKIKKSDRIISVGCGLGLIEEALLKAGFSNLEITEVSKAPLRWILPLFSDKHVHLGLFPDCIPHNGKYDLVLLASVEYFLDDAQLFSLLRSVHDRISPGGMCMLISWSVDIMNPAQRLSARIKDLIRYGMDKVGIKKRGQFWGYIRRPKEFRRIMTSAGLVNVRDGTLDTKTIWDTYWIEGTKYD